MLLPFERLQFSRHRNIGCLRLELDDERNAKKILLDGAEEEHAAWLERSSDGAAELFLTVVQLAVEGVLRRESLVAQIEECVAANGVRTGFGDDVHETAAGAADFGARAAAHHLEFANSRLREEEGRLVAAALVALQRIVEVSTINGHVRVDRPLSGNHQPEPIGLL